MFRLACLACAIFSSGLTAAPVVVSDIKGYGFNSQRQLQQFSVLVFDEQSGKVLARGDNSLLAKYKDARQLNGGGKTLLPGLIDGHGHVLGLGQNLAQVELRGSQSEQEAVARVAAFAQANQDAPWIVGRGWNQVLWPSNAFPSSASLDEAISDKPVYLERIDAHAGWANSKALALAGISKDSIDPPGGEIVRDANGNPTGVLIDNAMLLVEQHIPTPDNAAKVRALNAAFDHLLALGITSVHDAGVDSDTVKLYQQLAGEQKLPMRIYPMLSARDPQLPLWLEAGIIDDPTDYLDIRSVKIYGDGALGSRGAALIEPYSDKPEQKGLLVTEPDKLTQIMQMTIAAGFQTNVHAIGDLANRLVLDRFEQLVPEDKRAASRHRIEHAQIVSPKDIPRFAKLQVLPAMQAVHATSDKNMAGDRLGVARLRGAYAWRSFIDQGSIIVGGSDFPVELANAFHGIHASVTRQSQDNQPVGGWLPEQKLSLTEALRSFTVDAAYGAFQEDSMGTLAPGSWADFIIIDRDIYQIPSEQLWRVEVEQTFVHGKQVFAK
ncbi:amidohydrolase [Rheinheimera nanhaiensis]|uniref:Metal-dependent amidohydrolase with the TIM-barrel fold n=1 Tax=Rheinheimera nanhaiensis E407-8 TaxID=562729 RepID=I1DXP1_9GAMM|nr:amidohydrolase [Rheinheimera nanhaiensis]GAB58819.1 metal-dependent amidohydrolase with the TIM-barrel fold [Rheinheimera nanhaiensis E407-8]